jgi:hypothetical protein
LKAAEKIGSSIKNLDAETQFFLENCLAYLTRSAWNQLKAAEKASSGIDDLDVKTKFFLETCLSCLTRSAWNKLKVAEEAGGGIEDLDVETQFFLETCLFHLVCSAWEQLKAAEEACSGIEDLDNKTRFFLENDHAQCAWKRYHDAGENLDLLDADDRELLQKNSVFQIHHAKLLRECKRAGKTLSPEDQLIVKESKTCKEKGAETQKQKTDKKCKVLANQLVDQYGFRNKKTQSRKRVVVKSE